MLFISVNPKTYRQSFEFELKLDEEEKEGGRRDIAKRCEREVG